MARKKVSRGTPLRGRGTPAYPARLRSERARNSRKPGSLSATAIPDSAKSTIPKAEDADRVAAKPVKVAAFAAAGCAGLIFPRAQRPGFVAGASRGQRSAENELHLPPQRSVNRAKVRRAAKTLTAF